MQPVTLKNNQFTDALYLAQGLLLLSLLTMVVLGFTQTVYFLLTIPALLWFFNRNHNTIQQNKQFSLVMNAECEWRLVNIIDSKVLEVTLTNYWLSPVFLIVCLKYKKDNFRALILRKHVEGVEFSRLIQGVNITQDD